MQLRFVDYCPLYFTELREQPVPSHREGKFVLLRNAATRYAVFSPRQLSTYHANIVERFLWGQGIPGRYNAKHDVFTFDAPDWHVEGGAHWERDDDKGVLRLYGGSRAYGGLDLAPLAAALRDIPDLRDVKIFVEGRA
jgi:hypothetical protein